MIRLASLLRLLSAACLLLAVVLFFRHPLAHAFPALTGGLAAISGRAAPSNPGFMLNLRASVEGAVISVDGEPRGTSPFLGNVTCRDGDEVTLEVAAPGYRPWTTTFLCREGGQLIATPRLEPGGSAATP